MLEYSQGNGNTNADFRSHARLLRASTAGVRESVQMSLLIGAGDIADKLPYLKGELILLTTLPCLKEESIISSANLTINLT